MLLLLRILTNSSNPSSQRFQPFIELLLLQAFIFRPLCRWAHEKLGERSQHLPPPHRKLPPPTEIQGPQIDVRPPRTKPQPYCQGGDAAGGARPCPASGERAQGPEDKRATLRRNVDDAIWECLIGVSAATFKPHEVFNGARPANLRHLLFVLNHSGCGASDVAGLSYGWGLPRSSSIRSWSAGWSFARVSFKIVNMYN